MMGGLSLPQVKKPAAPGATQIEWTDFSFNPIRAINRETGAVGWHCVPVSAGCANCYAARMNQSRFGTGLPYAAQSASRVDVVLDTARLRAARAWRPPKRFVSRRGGNTPMVFMCDMTDLFGEWISFEMIDQVFALCGRRQDVVWQVLTKRPERMMEYLASRTTADGGWTDNIPHAAESLAGHTLAVPLDESVPWPLPNVWLGCSVSDQRTANTMIPSLLSCPAAVRFVSYEPALGPVDFIKINLGPVDHDPIDGVARDAVFTALGREGPQGRRIDWLIIGGESGPGARPFDNEWARSAVRQCRAAGVPAFVKQLARGHSEPSEWPTGLRVREWPR